MSELSERVGVELKVRDTKKLIQETDKHLTKQAAKKYRNKARDNGETIDEAEAIRRFYEDAKRMD